MYDQKLAHINHELKIESEKNALILKRSFEKEAEKFSIANASISQTQKFAIEKKLSAIETLWEGTLAARKNIPSIVSFLDILTENEYITMKDHPTFKLLIGEISDEKIKQMYEHNVGS